MKCNYHTHTSRCHHAVGSDEDYVKAALDAHFDELGFSDHMPWPFAHGFVSDCRMVMDELPDYLASIHRLQEKYRGQISIRLGLESEYFPRYRDHLTRLLDNGSVEYLILGAHFLDTEECNPYIGPLCREDDGVKRYAEAVIRAMDTGLFRCLAHPDVFMIYRMKPEEFTPACEEATRDIAKAAAEHHIPMEYNLLGLLSQLEGRAPRGYPCDRFWEVAKPVAGDVMIGVDAHDPRLLTHPQTFQTAVTRLTGMGYQPLHSLKL